MSNIKYMQEYGIFKFPLSADSMLHSIEDSARTCYASKSNSDTSEQFIRGLIAKGHESVIEHCMLKATIECSRACSHQIVRHRLCAYSQESQRYVNYENKGYKVLCLTDKSDIVPESYVIAVENAVNAYEELLAQGLKPEDARYVLPNCFMTKLDMSANLRQWRHIFKERALNDHAQWEIRSVMKQLLKQAKEYLPCIFGDLE